MKVIKKEVLTHDVYRFDFEFADPSWISGIFVGGHIRIHAEVDGKAISRMYSPTTLTNQKGYMTLVLKIYR